MRYLKSEDRFLVEDRIYDATESDDDLHQIEWRWQLAPGASIDVEGNAVVVKNGNAAMRLHLPSSVAWDIDILKGSEDPFAGWFSAGYGLLEAAPMVSIVTKSRLPLSVTTEIEVLHSARE